MNKNHIITTIVATVIAVIFLYHAYVVYQLETIVAQDHQMVGQIVNLINQSQVKK